MLVYKRTLKRLVPGKNSVRSGCVTLVVPWRIAVDAGLSPGETAIAEVGGDGRWIRLSQVFGPEFDLRPPAYRQGDLCIHIPTKQELVNLPPCIRFNRSRTEVLHGRLTFCPKRPYPHGPWQADLFNDLRWEYA